MWRFVLFLAWTNGAWAAARESEALHCARLMAALPISTASTWQSDSRAPIEEAFAYCLGAYIRVRTVNPPGHEELATAFLKEIFDHLGLVNQLLNLGGRSGLVAYLRPLDKLAEKKIILYHHIDVVPAIAEEWARADLPFSGSLEAMPSEPQGPRFIWGRGALDMKSTGMLQLFAMAFLQKNPTKLHKTLVFLASPDEESSALGAKGILQQMQNGGVLSALQGAEVLLNEGGYGVQREGKALYLIGTEEKGGAWLRLRHQNVQTLFAHLESLMGLLQPELKFEKNLGRQQGSCSIVSFRTPGQQVNVIPTRVQLLLACDKSLQTNNIAEAFRLSFSERKDLQVWVQASLVSHFTVTIELATLGHGSLGGLSALQVAARGLQNLAAIPAASDKPPLFAYFRYHRTPAIQGFIQSLKHVYPFYTKAGFMLRAADLFSWIDCVEQFFLRQTAASVYTERLFRSSCAWTGFELSPGSAPEAVVDCRLLHTGIGASPASLQAPAFISELQERAQDIDLNISLMQGWNYTSSPSDEAFTKMKEAILESMPDAIVSPWLSPAGSDNARFRAPQTVGSTVSAIPSYGFFPVNANGLTGSIHGRDERFPFDEVFVANRIYTAAVLRLVF